MIGPPAAVGERSFAAHHFFSAACRCKKFFFPCWPTGPYCLNIRLNPRQRRTQYIQYILLYLFPAKDEAPVAANNDDGRRSTQSKQQKQQEITDPPTGSPLILSQHRSSKTVLYIMAPPAAAAPGTNGDSPSHGEFLKQESSLSNYDRYVIRGRIPFTVFFPFPFALLLMCAPNPPRSPRSPSLFLLFRARSPQIAILDFGSQYSHLIARRVRELNVYCELYSCQVPASDLARHKLTAVILSGGPSSVYEEGAPHVSPECWDLIRERNIPVLGICYGMQELAHVFGGKVEPGLKHEYGKAMAHRVPDCQSQLFADMPKEFQVWMSHGDKLAKVPDGFHKAAATDNAEFVAIENMETRMWGLQFHPEVTHSPLGATILKNFCVTIAGAEQDWKMSNYADEFIDHVRAKVGPDGHVLGAVSGGVDSTVAAVLMTRAIGNRFHAVLVDNGCLRKDEATKVLKRMREDCGVNLRCVDASARFLDLLKGVTDPEEKRKIIGRTFIDVFQEEAKKIEADSGPCHFLLQGTLYPDVIESVSYKGPSATIKTHHNVGGLPASMHLKLIEPLRELFKDEVRELGIALGIDEKSVWRHPFPGPGLAIRILGEVTPERVKILQEADDICMELLQTTGHYRKIGQAFVVLLPVKTVGVMGDNRTYEYVASVRCVQTTDYMTADFYHLPYEIMGTMSNRVINEVRGINRLCYDISSKPPATIEWE